VSIAGKKLKTGFFAIFAGITSKHFVKRKKIRKLQMKLTKLKKSNRKWWKTILQYFAFFIWMIIYVSCFLLLLFGIGVIYDTFVYDKFHNPIQDNNSGMADITTYIQPPSKIPSDSDCIVWDSVKNWGCD